ncbi:hypothetical protein AVEN_217592-1 [Araneus ventricosus]|uniref:Uncharacterized protein n=1 Tax=Araneus ventricosus TaxID=182803 RepID=A0A4Y2FK68_ARAVE|nr:hypothetical protein AVEN_217592-1 [Araneus ventricosus]
MSCYRGLTDEGIRKILEASENNDIHYDGDIDDPDYQDLVHNLLPLSDLDGCEMDVEVYFITQNSKISNTLSDIDTSSLSSVDKIPPDVTPDCGPILWFRADSSFQNLMTIERNNKKN